MNGNENGVEIEVEEVFSCPICGSKDRIVLHDRLTDRVMFTNLGEWCIYLCNHCKVAYLNPRLSKKSILLAYDKYYTHDASFETDRQISLGKLRLSLRNGYLNKKYGYRLKPSYEIGYWIAYLFPVRRSREDRAIRHLPFPKENPRLLDIGCGNGFIMGKMKALGWDAYGIDTDPKAVHLAQENGLEVILGELGESTYEPKYFSAILMSHVIEHLHQPEEILRICYKILRPGGLLWIATPNIKSWGHKLFARHWRGLEVPRHLVIFNKKSLTSLLTQTGFSVFLIPLPVPMADWFFRSSLAISKNLDPYAKELPEDFGVSWLAKFADVVSMIIPDRAEELILVAKKPD